jgi:hypothetical protein
MKPVMALFFEWKPWENHGKTMGKYLVNGWLMDGRCSIISGTAGFKPDWIIFHFIYWMSSPSY